jgi:hypothetical protein
LNADRPAQTSIIPLQVGREKRPTVFWAAVLFEAAVFTQPHTAEMVSAEELGSAYTLAGMQMDLSGIIGPLFAALLIPLAGVSFIFGANGLGFLLMFLAFLQWKRVRTQSNLPLENFFESLTTAIRYVRYTPGIKILLARHLLRPGASFSLLESLSRIQSAAVK